jgi:hypothetical protein
MTDEALRSQTHCTLGGDDGHLWQKQEVDFVGLGVLDIYVCYLCSFVDVSTVQKQLQHVDQQLNWLRRQMEHLTMLSESVDKKIKLIDPFMREMGQFYQQLKQGYDPDINRLVGVIRTFFEQLDKQVKAVP